MGQLKLEGAKRTEKTAAVRNNGFIPAVLYGKGIETQEIQVDYSQFLKLFREIGESTIFTLSVDGSDFNVLVKDLQYHPVKDTFEHLDFYVVRMDEKISTEVELVFTGVSGAVKSEGGTLVKNISEVEVTCLPADLPQSIEVDISSLATFDDVITVADLNLPSGVVVEEEDDATVAVVSAPRSDEEIEALDSEVEMDVESVEGVTKEEADDGEGDDSSNESAKEEK